MTCFWPLKKGSDLIKIRKIILHNHSVYHLYMTLSLKKGSDLNKIRYFSFSSKISGFWPGVQNSKRGAHRKVEEMEIQAVMKKNEEGRRSFSSVFFHRTFSYFYKFLLVNF